MKNTHLFSTMAVLALLVLVGQGCLGTQQEAGVESDTQMQADTMMGGGDAAARTEEGWSVVLEGDEDVFELEDLNGSTTIVQRIGSTVQLNGLEGDVGSLTVTIPVEGSLEATSYNPTLFSLNWEDHDYACVGATESVTVTFDTVDPGQGSYTGTLTCYPNEFRQGDGFEVTMNGSFSE